jgi:8-amino-7-oxononanoate synthase
MNNRKSPLALHRGIKELNRLRRLGKMLGIADPYFSLSDGVNGTVLRQDDRELLNFSSYNYLGLAGDRRINDAAKAAIDRYSTSVSASRLASGERPVHQALEAALAASHGVDAAVSFVSGHATNVSMLGYLFDHHDLIVHDWLAHNSIMEGIRLSGATRLPFAHQDWGKLDELLRKHRHKHRQALIVVEGLYSMDGDIADLKTVIAIKKRHDAILMVDEAHSLGVLGKSGRGIAEHQGIDPNDVDIWMGTLSKSLASCGGYVAGSQDLVDNLRHFCPGFLFSVGMAPPAAAAALAALEIMQAESDRVVRLQAISAHFLQAAKTRGLDTSTAQGFGVVPIMVRDDIKAVQLSNTMVQRGVNVLPMMYPSVPQGGARLRFFLSANHTTQMVDSALDALMDAMRDLKIKTEGNKLNSEAA